MYHKGKAIAALEAKRLHFTAYDSTLADDLRRLQGARRRLRHMSLATLTARLASTPWPGARPTHEFAHHPGLVIPFAQTWTSHEDARRWALTILQDVPTFAVDGSQLPPSRDFSIPVAAIQIGWFENPHSATRPYTKAIAFEVLAPDELAGAPYEGSGFPEWRLHLRRFQGELSTLTQRMHQAAPDPEKPVCLLDGSLVLSFLRPMQPDRQRPYIEAVLSLLETSAATRVPLIAFTDTSYASDLVALLDTLEPGQGLSRVSDATLLRPFMRWGSRTPAFVCARDDGVLAQYGAHATRIGFVYLKTTTDGPPARIEFPLWLLEDGLLDIVLDIVRAECLVGVGYPYAIETADAVAVITSTDRAQFYHTFQEFATSAGLQLRHSRKAFSKRQRRVK